MIAVYVLSGLSLVVAAGVLGLALAQRPAPPLPPWDNLDGLHRERVVVTLKSGASFSGVLFETDDRTWVLKEAIALAAADRGENVPLDGDLLLFVSNIEYSQKP